MEASSALPVPGGENTLINARGGAHLLVRGRWNAIPSYADTVGSGS